MDMKLKKKAKNRVPEIGDIVYWCHTLQYGKFEVRWGRVSDVFSRSEVYIDYLSPKENRIVVDCKTGERWPIDEFRDYRRYRKLPKGWTYNTPLYAIEREHYEGDDSVIDIKDPDCIKDLYDRGLLVERDKLFGGKIDVEITKEGYRIVKSYSMFAAHPPLSIRLSSFELYKEYKEANRAKEIAEHEILRQTSLTDAEWSLENIINDIKRFAKGNGIRCDSVQIREVIDYFSNLDKIDEVETRIYGHNLQWKREKNKRWATILEGGSK